MIKTEQT